MAPNLYLWFVRIPVFKLAIALAFIVALIFVIKQNKKYFTFDNSVIIDSAIIFMFSSFIGGKLLYLLVAGFEPGILLSDRYMFFGSLIFSLSAIFVYLKVKKISVPKFFDLISPALGLGIAIGDIGCLALGSCYGTSYNGIFSITFPSYVDFTSDTPFGVPLYPTQYLLFLNGLLMFASVYLFRYLQKNKPNLKFFNIDGGVFFFASITYLIGIFIIEFLRGDYRGRLFASLSVNQWLCIILFVGILYLWQHTVRLKKS